MNKRQRFFLFLILCALDIIFALIYAYKPTYQTILQPVNMGQDKGNLYIANLPKNYSYRWLYRLKGDATDTSSLILYENNTILEINQAPEPCPKRVPIAIQYDVNLRWAPRGGHARQS